MRYSAALLIGTSALAVCVPAAAQTAAEQTAQAVNPPPTAPPTVGPEEGAIIVTATKRASTVQEVPFSVNAATLFGSAETTASVRLFSVNSSRPFCQQRIA